MKTIVALKNINKAYTRDQVTTHALRDINLTISEGEFVSITGPSGCGKSTLLNILGLLDVPSEGKYSLTGIETDKLGVDQRAYIRNLHIGYVFQSFNLIDSLTVFDNVALVLEHRGEKRERIRDAVNKQLEAVNMASRADYKPNQLSGGQQQRVAIARALVGNPDLLLVDEPTGNLDSRNGDAVMQLLIELNRQGKTLIMVTHDERYAHMAKRRVRLLDGEMIMEQQEAVA